MRTIFLLLSAVILTLVPGAFAQRITESLDNWTLGPNQPTIQNGTRGDGSTGGYHYLPVGTSSYYYMVQTEGEGMVEFWVYDPSKCLAAVDPGYGARGMGWGLYTSTYQAAAITDDRASYVDGCRGYSPWSTSSPYSPWWFVSGVRGNGDVPWTAKWYKWTAAGTFDNITFTLYDVNYSSGGNIVMGNPSLTIDAASFGGSWSGLFGGGWQGFWAKGDVASTGIEDPTIDVTSGTGVFAEFGGLTHPVARPYHETSWGSIKALYR
jgi:hypothetical protein